MINNRVSVIGLGKVGLTLAVNLSNSGSNVIGFDLSEKLINEIKNLKFETKEPMVQDKLYSTLNKNFFVTSDIKEAVIRSDISFVIVPTPSNSKGGFTNKYVINACQMIGSILREKDTRHTIAVVSTVLPGSSDYQIIPAIEKESGLKIGVDFGYCYNPAFIALGEIVRGFAEPNFVLIGESDSQSGETTLNAINKMLVNKPPISRMTLIEAEITKIASNTHETMRVSFANMLMNICTEVPNTDVDKITKALAHRMGKRFFKGATPYGGPCWPRDNIALSQFMKLCNASPILPEAVHLSNEKIGEYLLKKIKQKCQRNSIIGIIGLAYKNGTAVTEESFALKLYEGLLNNGHNVIGWDPLVSKANIPPIFSRINLCSSIHDCISKADIVIIANPIKEANNYEWENQNNEKLLVIDCWRCLSNKDKQNISNYWGLGINKNQEVRDWIISNIEDEYIKLIE